MSAAGGETVVAETGESFRATGGGILGGIFAATVLMILFCTRYPRWWFDFAPDLTRCSDGF